MSNTDKIINQNNIYHPGNNERTYINTVSNPAHSTVPSSGVSSSTISSRFLTSSDLVANSEQQTSQDLKAAVSRSFASVSGGLELVEQRIRSTFHSEASELAHIANYLLQLGGKRIRPILALLSARLFGMETPNDTLIDAASGIELIHMATLLHDDIIDESPKRRHQPSAFAKFGFTPTLLAGDFLWVRAFGLCAHLGEFIVRSTEEACVELTEGEVLEGHLSGDDVVRLEHYERIVSKKTASLFGLSTAIGAHAAGATPVAVEKLKLFGRDLGVAFQMVDDILDVVANEDLLGKPSGTDLRKKTPSLVNILWLTSGDREATRFFSQPEITGEAAKEAIQHILTTDVVAQCRSHAQTASEKAKSHLLTLSREEIDTGLRDDLCQLVDFTLGRAM